MIIYGLIVNNGDGSYGWRMFKTKEERDKQIEYEEKYNDCYSVDEGEKDIDTDNIRWSIPDEPDEDEE